MAQVVVDVMPKPELLDPQGQAIADALPGLGCPGVRNVRQGKRFELETEGELTDEQRQNIERVAATLLTNPVIENYTLRVVSDRSTAGSPA